MPDMDEKSKAELELILMDNQEGNNNEHFSMKEVIKSEKDKKNKKNKKVKRLIKKWYRMGLWRTLMILVSRKFLKAMIMLLTLPTVSSKTETMKKILKERSARNKDKKNKKNSSKNATKNSKRSRSELESNDNVHSLAEKIKKKQKQVILSFRG